MSFDAWIVAFGLATLMQDLAIVRSNLSYLVVLGVGLLDGVMLYRFFTVTLPLAKRLDALAAASPPPGTSDAPAASPPPSAAAEPARRT